jgi:hypothetical protein
VARYLERFNVSIICTEFASVRKLMITYTLLDSTDSSYRVNGQLPLTSLIPELAEAARDIAGEAQSLICIQEGLSSCSSSASG